MDARTLKTLHKRLLARLAELDQLTQHSLDDRQAVTLDQQSVGRVSRVDALQRQAMAEAQERQRQNERARIAAALRRIEADEYGWCTSCGEEIASKRLEVDPAAALCITCAQSKG